MKINIRKLTLLVLFAFQLNNPLCNVFADNAKDPFLAISRESTKQIGRGNVVWLADQHVSIKDAYLLLNESPLEDFTFSFEGRAPENAGAEEVGIWATFRHSDRNHRYVVGLRGAPHSDIYLARYAPDGNDKMLALQSVPTVLPGEWASLKIIGRGNQIKVYLNGKEYVSVDDKKALFAKGNFGIGGGYHKSEYRNVSISPNVKSVESQATLSFAHDAIKINFQPADESVPAGWKADSGAVYTSSRGYGWTKEVGTRNRKQYDDFMDNTLVTLAREMTENEFKLDIAPGEYLFTLRTGDSYTSALNVTYGEHAQFQECATGEGEFKLIYGQVSVGNNGLVLKFNRKGNGVGTSLNWVVIEPRKQLSPAQWAKGDLVKDMSAEKIALREKQRTAYKPVAVAPIEPGRTEVSLDGDWLFLPDYEFSKTQEPQSIKADDGNWHVMNVPDLWSPYSAWLFGETLPALPYDKGASDSYFEYRHARVEAFTFDWEKTKSAWYRRHVVLPEIPQGKRFELHFDAIAKVANVYVNGIFVGKNYGMFGDISFDITEQLKAGTNVIAVKVDQERTDIKNGDEVIDVAISVEITRKMLSSLPYGMTREDARGIWQPTKLVITDSSRITDLFVKPRLDGADVDATLKNMGSVPAMLTPRLSVVGISDNVELVQLSGEATSVPAGESKAVTLSFSNLKPRLWFPNDPQLYTFAANLYEGDAKIDSYSVVSGFKTFETKGNRLFLNGRPYALRGANHNPNMLAPNDAKLADRYMQIMKENNINSTRFHALPGTEPWMSAADRHGVLISQEGCWPWLMLRGPIPPQDALDIWMDEFQRMIKKYRNHPSLMLWTVNNEMKFHVYHKNNPNKTEALEKDNLERWRVVSKAVKMIRETDPTHPIVADSCYMRNYSWTSKQSPDELGIDDGDIDDKHAYYNWYNESFFNLPLGASGEGSNARPLIGQEMSTGYYNGDSGHPVRAYLFVHQTPQSWVGQWAYEHQDPSIFDTRHAMLTKELAEYYRRERREDWAGTLIFGLATWFKNPWDAEKIQPYPVVTDSLKNAMSPILVSARLTGRNYFAGDSFSIPVSIINDAEDGSAINSGVLTWRIMANGNILSNGSFPVSTVEYYTNKTINISLNLPAKVPGGRVDAELLFDFNVDGKTVSSNHYAVKIAEKNWARSPVQTSKSRVSIYKASDITKKLFEALNSSATYLKKLQGTRLNSSDILVIDGNLSNEDSAVLKAIIKSSKGTVLWISPKSQAQEVFPEQILNYREQNGEIVNMLVPESPIFDGMEIGDMAWMGGPSVETVPLSSLGGYHVAWENTDLTVLAEEMNAHGYLDTPKDKLKSWVSPLVEINVGEGRVILTEMSLNTALADPLALRLWANSFK
jgi:beta-galactosidase